MAISLKNWEVERKNDSFLTDWTYWILSSDYLLWLLDNIAWSSVHPCLFSTVSQRPLVGLRPPSNRFILWLHLTKPAASRCVLDRTRLQKAFSFNTSVTRGVTSPAAHRGIWHSAGATKSWLHYRRKKKVFCLDEKKSRLNRNFLSGWEEKRSDMTFEYDWKTQKNYSDKKRMRCQEILNPCCTTVRFLSIFFNFSSTALKVSLFLSSLVRRLNLAVLHSSFRIEKFLDKMAISFSDLNN